METQLGNAFGSNISEDRPNRNERVCAACCMRVETQRRSVSSSIAMEVGLYVTRAKMFVISIGIIVISPLAIGGISCSAKHYVYRTLHFISVKQAREADMTKKEVTRLQKVAKKGMAPEGDRSVSVLTDGKRAVQL